MTDDASRGWPGEPGVPSNPERDGAPDRVTVTAADFNGATFDGCPFSSAPDWLRGALESGLIEIVAADTDYAQFDVRTKRGWKRATCGDTIRRWEDGSLGVIAHPSNAGVSLSDHTAALAAVWAAGEARGIERAAVWHDGRSAEFQSWVDRDVSDPAQAFPEHLQINREHATAHRNSAAHLRALTPFDQPALAEALEKARADEREALRETIRATIDKHLPRSFRQAVANMLADQCIAAIRARGEKGEG